MISRPGLCQHRMQGFTLLEILVVTVVLVIITAIIAPGIIHRDVRRLADESERFVMLVNLARQEAIMSSRVWQLSLEADSGRYGFLRFDGSDFEEVNEAPFNGRHITEAITWKHLRVNAEPVTDRALVHLFPTGEQEDFELELAVKDERQRISLGVTGPALVYRDEDE